MTKPLIDFFSGTPQYPWLQRSTTTAPQPTGVPVSEWTVIGSCFPQAYANSDSAVRAFARQWEPLARKTPLMQWMALALREKAGTSRLTRLMMRINASGSQAWCPAPLGPPPNVFSRPCVAATIEPGFLPQEIQICLTRAPVEDGARRIYLHLPASGDLFAMRFCPGVLAPRALGGHSGEGALGWLRQAIQCGILEVCWLQGQPDAIETEGRFIALSTFEGARLVLCAHALGQPMMPVDDQPLEDAHAACWEEHEEHEEQDGQ
jgi:hypothetical protein